MFKAVTEDEEYVILTNKNILYDHTIYYQELNVLTNKILIRDFSNKIDDVLNLIKFNNTFDLKTYGNYNNFYWTIKSFVIKSSDIRTLNQFDSILDELNLGKSSQTQYDYVVENMTKNKLCTIAHLRKIKLTWLKIKIHGSQKVINEFDHFLTLHHILFKVEVNSNNKVKTLSYYDTLMSYFSKSSEAEVKLIPQLFIVFKISPESVNQFVQILQKHTFNFSYNHKVYDSIDLLARCQKSNASIVNLVDVYEGM